jgi:hypothetical protein
MARRDLSPDSVFLATRANASDIHRAVARGELRLLATRLYTRRVELTPEDAVRRDLWAIVGLYFPGAVVSDRTALEGAPAPDGSFTVVVADQAPRDLQLPGVVLRARRGAGPSRDIAAPDMPVGASLYIASEPRALLENLRPARAREFLARALGREGVERRLVQIALQRGETALDDLNRAAAAIAPHLDLLPEAARLAALITDLRMRGRARTAEGQAFVRGTPYDARALDRVLALRDQLAREVLPRVEDPAGGEAATASDRLQQGRARDTRAFWEAYFSNYIEGTEFLPREARAIIFAGTQPAGRLADAAEMRGTWEAIRLHRPPSRVAETFIAHLQSDHARLMSERPDMTPGHFKTIDNRVGGHVFVAPHLVRGTLIEGHRVLATTADPFARALLAHYLVATVHPFLDGNGRVARLALNAELEAAGLARAIVPTVMREDYLGAMEAMEFAGRAAPMLSVFSEAQRLARALPGDLDQAQRFLERSSAFDLPRDRQGRRSYLRLDAHDPPSAETALPRDRAVLAIQDGADLQAHGRRLAALSEAELMALRVRTAEAADLAGPAGRDAAWPLERGLAFIDAALRSRARGAPER